MEKTFQMTGVPALSGNGLSVNSEVGTALQVMLSDKPNLQRLKKQVDHAELKTHVMQGIYENLQVIWPDLDSLTISMVMTDDILETKPDWKLDDIHCLFKFIRHNQGDERLKVYGKINLLTLMQMVSVYEEHRSEQREIIVSQYKSQEKETIALHPEVAAKLKEIRETIERESPQKAVPPVNEMQEIHNRWMRQFDTLYSKRPLPYGKFIKRYGKAMDINDYLNYKQQQYNRHQTPF
jgi:hypothetical protein